MADGLKGIRPTKKDAMVAKGGDEGFGCNCSVQGSTQGLSNAGEFTLLGFRECRLQDLKYFLRRSLSLRLNAADGVL